MGYCMTQRDTVFTIKKENTKDALNAIKKMAEEVVKKGGGGDGTESWYSWVNTSEFINAQTIKEALNAWRWIAEVNDDGDVTHIYFNGEKLGDDAQLFDAIAPFVDNDSYIQMDGEDGAKWRWVFKNGVMEEKSANINWE